MGLHRVYNSCRMGFIEDERKRHEAKPEPPDEFDKAMSRKMGRYANEKWHFADGYKGKLKKCIDNLEESGLQEMFHELCAFGSYKERRCDFDYTHNPSYVDMVHITDPDDHSQDFRHFSIKVSVDGTIEFDTGKNLSGHTVLSKDQWQGKEGKERLEQALGKAFKNPMTRPNPRYQAPSSPRTSSTDNGMWIRGEETSN